MKNKILLLVCSFTLLVQSCGNSQNEMSKGDCLTILLDRTDSLKASTDLTVNDFALHLQVTSTDPLASAHVRILPITNIRFEKSYPITIAQTDIFSGNEIDRKVEIDTFKAQISSVLGLISKMPHGINGSAIFESISIELNSLAVCNKGTTKTMVVVSDLLENTSWFNSYNSNELAAFVEDPMEFNRCLDKFCPIKQSIKGITLYLIHQPESVLQDNQFYKLSGLLKDYLEQKGAKVNISASLN